MKPYCIGVMKKEKYRRKFCEHCRGTIILLVVRLLSCRDSRETATARNVIEQKFIDAGLVDIRTIDATIEVDLVNSDEGKNYFRENLYSELQIAYLRREVALKLSQAQKILKSKNPDFSLLIMDAARPRSVSLKMFNKMKGTRFEKYVTDPGKGSMHNYGIAVDITIVDGSNKELDMGFSPFYKSRVALTIQYLLYKKDRKLTEEHSKNRRLLVEVMTSAGFIPLNFEWWHFNGLLKDVARERYNIIE
ncbi:D-alanyl-D-alanine dipeptidase [subsurface metagenome]